jgi:hypothetical protein
VLASHTAAHRAFEFEREVLAIGARRLLLAAEA